MHYNISSSLIIVSIIVLGIALIVAIIAYKNIGNNVPSTTSQSDINSIKGVLMFFIIIDSIMLLVSLYGLAKIRTGNMGGWIGFILGLIIIIITLIAGISAINKIDSVAYPRVLNGLVINTVAIVLVYFLLILSVLAKPKLCTGNSIKKLYQSMKSKVAECKPAIECAPIKNECPPITNCPPAQFATQAQQYVQNPYLNR